MASQHWDDEEFCDSYSKTWEISWDEVHYGWLAPGERQLQLIDIVLNGANVLDIGCGMGENLIALERRGAVGYGIDISRHMLKRAHENLSNLNSDSSSITLLKQDMRQTDFFPGTCFDMILSVYSLEYLDSPAELKDLAYNLFKRLKPGGIFIFCFSHQLQHVRHNMLANQSGKSSEDRGATLIYSFCDVAHALNEAGFLLERVIEQGTRDPSQLSYEDALKYPYHFHRGRNPCIERFDGESNKVPHTVIFKARKLDSHGLVQNGQLVLQYQARHINIWGQKRSVNESIEFRSGTRRYCAHKLAPKDSVVGLCEVIDLVVDRESMQSTGEQELQLNLDGSPHALRVPVNCVQAFLHRRLASAGLTPVYARGEFPGSERTQSGLFIKRIDPICDDFANLFSRQQLGILVFINGEEPASGTIGLEDITITPHDHIQVVYVATSWGKEWRPRKLSGEQMDLFLRKS